MIVPAAVAVIAVVLVLLFLAWLLLAIAGKSDDRDGTR
jgi:hypothetical protein